METTPTDSETLCEGGVRLLKDGRLEEAAAAFVRAVELNPALAKAHHNLGDALFGLARYEEAIAAFNQALATKPDFAWSHNNLANALARLERWDEAAAAYQRAADIGPGVAAFHEGASNALMKLQRWEQAVAACRRAIALEPRQFWSHHNLGDALGGLRRWEEAAVAYGDAVALDPDAFWTHDHLAQALSRLERWEEAATSYRRAIALRADVSSSHHCLGDVLSKLKRWEEAVGAYRRAIELAPESPWSYSNLAHALGQLGRWEDVAEAYGHAIALDPGVFSFHQNLGTALLSLHRWREAASACEAAIALKPDQFWPHHNLGNALSQLKQWEGAAAAYERAIELQPKLFWSHHNLGNARLHSGRYDVAVPAFQDAVRLNPDHAVSWRHLGDALMKLNRLDEAASAYEAADRARPAWSRRDPGADVLAMEQWMDGLDASMRVGSSTSTGASPSTGRLLFVLDNDYGELTTIMYLLLGQEMASRATVLLPPRLYVHNAKGLAVSTETYASAADVLRAVDALRPEIVFLCSGYLFTIHEIFDLSTFERLVGELRARGCQVVTSDPFLGLLAWLKHSNIISIDIPENASAELRGYKAEQDKRLFEHFSRSFEILEGLPHLYPTFPAAPGQPPPTEVSGISSFNPRLLCEATGPEAVAPAKPVWLFVLASRDYEVQAIFQGKPRVVNILAEKIREALRAGRHPVFIGPFDCVQALMERLSDLAGSGASDGITLSTFCPFKRFSSLLLAAEYVFYWNALSHSMFLRLFNGRPVFLFDRGHLVRNVGPLYDRIVDWYYQGWHPIYLDQEQPLKPDVLAPLAAAYRDGAASIAPHFRRAPLPDELIEHIRRGSLVQGTPRT